MSPETLTRSTARFFSGTLLSRITGLLRDIAMAIAFGDHPAVGAFMVAFRFSNLFRRLFGEGALQATLVPHFEGLRAISEAKAYLFFRDFASSLVVLLASVVLVSEGALLLLGKGEVIRLTALMTPGLIFISLYGIYLAFLQCHHKLFMASVAPAFCNIVWIIGTFALRSWDVDRAMPILATLVVAGVALQWAVTIPQTKRLLANYPKTKITLFSSEVRKMGKSASIGLIGAGAMQISACVDALFARWADVRGPVYLWYALRLEQLPLALIGIACTSALIPRLSRSIKRGNRAEEQSLIALGMRQMLLLLTPMTLGLLLLSQPLVRLMYGHGAFTHSAIAKTSQCLVAYGAALVPSVLIILYTSIAYARNKHRLPTKAALIAIGLNALLNAFFVFVLKLGAVSIALATAISTWGNFFMLHKTVGSGTISKPLLSEVALSAALGSFSLFGAMQCSFPTPLIECFAQGSALVLGCALPISYRRLARKGIHDFFSSR